MSLRHHSFRVPPEIHARIGEIVKDLAGVKDDGGTSVKDLSVSALARAATDRWLIEAEKLSNLELMEKVRPFVLSRWSGRANDGPEYRRIGMRLTPEADAAIKAVVAERVGPLLNQATVTRAILFDYIEHSKGFTPAEHLARIRPWLVPRGRRANPRATPRLKRVRVRQTKAAVAPLPAQVITC